MNQPDATVLMEELEQFRREKERIRKLVGQVGGKFSEKQDRLITIIFTAAMVLLFILDALRHTLHIKLPFPPLFSIELGVLLVSIKIIWMIHKQGKVEHFQFWMLNTIEFRINDIAQQLRSLEKSVERMEEQNTSHPPEDA